MGFLLRQMLLDFSTKSSSKAKKYDSKYHEIAATAIRIRIPKTYEYKPFMLSYDEDEE